MSPLPEIGQRWQHYNATMDTIKEYVLIERESQEIGGRLARLRNVESEGIAHVTCRSLERGEKVAGSHWEFLRDPTEDELMEIAA